MMSRAVDGSLGQVKDWLFSSSLHGLQWLVMTMLRSLGWPGVVAIACGLLLLASLSVRAIRFLYQPRGFRSILALSLIGLAISWLFWPQMTPTAAKELPAYEPDARRADKPIPPVKTEPARLLAMATPEPVAIQATPPPLPTVLPPLVYDPPPLVIPTLPPATVIVPHRPPVIVNRPKPHPPAARQQAAVNRAQQQARINANRRAMVNRQLDMMMNQMMRQYSGGMGMHPMGGMHGGGMGGHHGGHH
jgi:hypothetical protein